MAGGADLLVDLKSTLQHRLVVGAEDAVEIPLLVRQRILRRDSGKALGQLVLCTAGADSKDQRKGGAAANDDAAHYAFSIGLAGTGAGTNPPPFNTASLMLCGKGSGRSNTLRSGMRITKWKKYQVVAMRAITT